MPLTLIPESKLRAVQTLLRKVKAPFTTLPNGDFDNETKERILVCAQFIETTSIGAGHQVLKSLQPDVKNILAMLENARASLADVNINAESQEGIVVQAQLCNQMAIQAGRDLKSFTNKKIRGKFSQK